MKKYASFFKITIFLMIGCISSISSYAFALPILSPPPYSKINLPIQYNQHEKLNIYIAAALFSLRERSFNNYIASELGKSHQYHIFLPQRKGFEFDPLHTELQKNMNAEEATRAEQLIIYYLDMGYFIAKSDVVIAILDEDLDPGVMVEITFANLLGKKVIGIRTDIRSPYGADPESGLHFFSLLQLDDYIYFQNDRSSSSDVTLERQKIISALKQKLDTTKLSTAQSLDLTQRLRDINVKRIIDGAQILFSGIPVDEINSVAGLKLIAKRYQEHRKELERIYPAVETVYFSQYSK